MFSHDWNVVVAFWEDHHRGEALLMTSYQEVHGLTQPITGISTLLLITFILSFV